MEVNLEPIKVMFVRSVNGPDGAAQAFNKLEAKLPSIKKRKFYGLSIGWPIEYLACVALMEGDEPEKLGFETMVIPGGWYAQKPLLNWSKNIPLIAKIFKELMQKYTFDPSRPCVEYYRSLYEV